VAFERPGIKLSSRSSMGVYRLRFDGEKGGEPVAVLGTTSDQDLVLLGKTGALLRLGREEVPSRKGASLGRRLWRTPVVGAVAVAESSRLLIATRRGRLLCFPAMQLPTRQALRKGVLGIRLDGDDAPETIGTA
jgi:DNA gyrase/topoisomerase IV subunit A